MKKLVQYGKGRLSRRAATTRAAPIMAPWLSQRQAVEEALQQVHRKYQNLINSIQAVVWEARVQAGKWRFLYVSEQAGLLLGFRAQRWLREPSFWEHRLHPADRPWVLSARARAVTAGKNHVLEYRMIDAERRAIWVRDSLTIERQAGRVRLRGILINVTEVKTMEAALRHANNELEARVRQRTADLTR